MDRCSYWIDTAKIESQVPLKSDLSVNTLVIGGGITGITTAYLLAKAGIDVALIERNELASIDTGHTTAHLTYVTDHELETLVKNFGRDHAAAVWDAGAAAIDEIERIVNLEQIDCEFCRLPGFLHASIFSEESETDSSDLQTDAKLARELGFDATFVESVPLFGVYGVRYANQAKFHPRKYLGALVQAVIENGGRIFEKSAAEEFDAEKQRVKVNGQWISFERVIMATNNPLVGLASMTDATLFQTKISLYSSYVLGARVPRGSLPEAMFWDVADPYNYLRMDRHDDFDYAIFGGEDHKTGQVRDTEECYQRLREKLNKFAPGATVDHCWSGQVIETSDGLPFIGENANRQFIATGYCGNGITFGTTAAIMARDWITGTTNPWRKLFDPDRKFVRHGAWDYLRENKDYPFYLIKGRLARPEADSVRELKPNQGMIIKSAHGKVAASRDMNGNVHKVSAVCTHMGCIVRWNSAEQTWDCPCHGSRFQPTGEVIAGPAETPLSQP